MLTLILLAGSFTPELTGFDMKTSPRYSSFDRDRQPPALIDYCDTAAERRAIYDNVETQMELYDRYPLAFVHPSPPPAHIA